MKVTLMLSIVIVIVLLLTTAGYLLLKDNMNVKQQIKEGTTSNTTKSVDFSTTNSEFLFSAEIPNSFQVEYLPNVRAINIYNPNATGASNLDKSQLYLSFFKANTFLTLSTVTITRRDATTLNGHSAVLYEITKKEQVPAFAGQPSWRNSTHLALDVRATSNNPAYFYSFAYHPLLPERTFNNIVNSIDFY